MIRRQIARSDEQRAVLRVEDQRHDRVPTACVKTGIKTDRAVRVRAVDLGPSTSRWEEWAGGGVRLVAFVLRRPMTTLVLPVDAVAWKRWRTRLGRAVVVIAFAIGIIAVGIARGESGMLVLGVAVGAFGWRMRMRAWRTCWVGLTLRAAAGEIVVSRVHPGFAEEAKRLYLDAVWRGPRGR